MDGISWRKNRKDILFYGIAGAICLVRLWSVLYVPDVFCDEQDILAHMQSILSSFRDTEGNLLPLFSSVGEGLVTYTYLYPMALLGKIVGVTSYRIRGLQQILTILACWLSAKAVENFTKDRELFRIVSIVSLTLPWGFVQANRIWDPALVPIYFAIHFYLLSRYFQLRQSGKSGSLCFVSVFGSLVLLAVIYPPCRIPAVAMWGYVLHWLYREEGISPKQFLWMIAACVILSLPLAINLLDPAFNARSVSLLVFNEKMSLWESVSTWVANFWEMISPRFLFFMGDSNYRHAIPYRGMLGLLSLLPMICVWRKPKNQVTRYMLFTIVTTFLSVALTNEGIPHSLRGCLAWLPFSVLIGFGWKWLTEAGREKRVLMYLMQAAVLVSFLLYVRVYIQYYCAGIF